MNIPKEALQLMLAQTPSEVWANMIETGVISEMALRTFGGIINPIVNNETGETVGFVTHWYHNRQTSVTSGNGDSDLKLVYTYDWTRKMGPEKAVEIWQISIEPFKKGDE